MSADRSAGLADDAEFGTRSCTGTRRPAICELSVCKSGRESVCTAACESASESAGAVVRSSGRGSSGGNSAAVSSWRNRAPHMPQKFCSTGFLRPQDPQLTSDEDSSVTRFTRSGNAVASGMTAGGSEAFSSCGEFSASRSSSRRSSRTASSRFSGTLVK